MDSSTNRKEAPVVGSVRTWEWLRPHSVFLLLAVLFGLAVLVANPPYQAPDENDHYWRAYQLSEGGVVGRKQGNNAGGDLPALVYWHTDMGEMPFHTDVK